MMHAATALFVRELRLASTQGHQLSIGIVFFLCLVMVITFGVGPNQAFLRKIGAAILWTGPLFSILLGIGSIIQTDQDDGTLDQYRISSLPMVIVVLVKLVAYWFTAALPLVCVAPFFGLMLAMEVHAILGTFICLLLGTPALVAFGGLAAILTSSVPRSGMLLTIIAIPFLVPTLIFGVSASIGFAVPALPFLSPFLLMCAFTLFALVVCCLAGAAALCANMPNSWCTIMSEDRTAS